MQRDFDGAVAFPEHVVGWSCRFRYRHGRMFRSRGGTDAGACWHDWCGMSTTLYFLRIQWDKLERVFYDHFEPPDIMVIVFGDNLDHSLIEGYPPARVSFMMDCRTKQYLLT